MSSCIALVTTDRVRLISQDYSTILSEYSTENTYHIYHAAIEKDSLVVATQNGKLLYFSLEGADKNLKPAKNFEFEADISSVALSENKSVAYVSLWDAPDYSICVLDLDSMTVLAKHATSSFVERYAFKGFQKNLEVASTGSSCPITSALLTLNTSYPMNAVKSI
jgi:hypothetical protein